MRRRAERRSSLWVRSIAALLGGALSLIGAGGSSAVASAAGAPSAGDVILSTSLPGFVVAPAGEFNGPLDKATLMTNTADPDALAEIENGSIAGYLRCWGYDYASGMGLVCDTVMQFPNPAQAQTVLGILQATLPAQYDLTTFKVAAPSGATGYATHNALIPGSTDYIVSFSRGNYASFIMSATPAYGVSAAQIEQLGEAQWAAMPAEADAPATPTTPTTPNTPTPTSRAVALPTNEAAALSPAELSSSGLGGIEALAVLFVGVVAAFLLVVFAIDFAGRWRRIHPVFGDPGPEPERSVPPPLERV